MQSEENVKDYFRGASPKLCHPFWKRTDAIKCVEESLKKLVVRGFQGKNMEIEFTKFIAQRANVLKKIVIFTSHHLNPARVRARLLSRTPLASDSCEVLVFPHPQFYQKGTPWCYQRGFALSNRDPFDVTNCQSGPCGA